MKAGIVIKGKKSRHFLYLDKIREVMVNEDATDIMIYYSTMEEDGGYVLIVINDLVEGNYGELFDAIVRMKGCGGTNERKNLE